ncbi:hypothetical protein RCL_jg17677.t1 [Rhizophagus clarus]|uniref:Uncharacterized protein n=1 Tax=Rhizophagus clarus TaxID=94130 RepID=A0A8H3L3K2_9GLOM|nr:hypothetical protein RCL_jg17677.t1 [Rhizophagus clarus]
MKNKGRKNLKVRNLIGHNKHIDLKVQNTRILSVQGKLYWSIFPAINFLIQYDLPHFWIVFNNMDKDSSKVDELIAMVNDMLVVKY